MKKSKYIDCIGNGINFLDIMFHKTFLGEKL